MAVMKNHIERHAAPIEPDAKSADFYRKAMQALDQAGVPYLVGGGYAMAYYTGIARNTKDLDLFVRPADRDRLLTTLTALGYKTEFFYPFWIAKVLDGEAFIDVLYNSGNGVCVVDDEWFTHATEGTILGVPVRLCPAEEMIWSKGFIMERERYDGADIAHLLRARADQLNWRRLLRRFRPHWRSGRFFHPEVRSPTSLTRHSLELAAQVSRASDLLLDLPRDTRAYRIVRQVHHRSDHVRVVPLQHDVATPEDRRI